MFFRKSAVKSLQCQPCLTDRIGRIRMNNYGLRIIVGAMTGFLEQDKHSGKVSHVLTHRHPLQLAL